MNKENLFKTFLILLVALPIFLFSPDRSEANVGSITGRVYFTDAGGVEHDIPGVTIYKTNLGYVLQPDPDDRVRTCEEVIRENAIRDHPDWTWSRIQRQIYLVCRHDRGGIEGIADGDGTWYIGNGAEEGFSSNPPFLPDYFVYGSLVTCPTGDMGAVSTMGDDGELLNYCGLNCLENPHRMRPYFPSDVFDWIEENFPLIQIDREDIRKGGGSWKTKSGTELVDVDTITEDPRHYIELNATWDDVHGDEPLDGYEVYEYYEMQSSNDAIYSGFDFEWVPPISVEPNNPPKIEAVTPVADSPWLGTPEDEDNGPACTDNNPYTYTARASDEDGSDDIDRIEFNLARTDQLEGDGDNDWPLRVMFAKKWKEAGGREYAENTFFVRDAQLLGGESNNCLNADGEVTALEPTGYNKVDGSGWSAVSDPSTLTAKSNSDYSLWCYGVDDHSWENATHVETTLGGQAVDVYYITNDIFVDGDGYNAKLLGAGAEGNWQTNTFVAYQKDGNVVDAQFRVEYLGGGDTLAENENSKWMRDYVSYEPGMNQYHNVWRVTDMARDEDEIADAVEGEEMLSMENGESHHKIGRTNIDFRYPTITVETPIPQGNELLQIPWNAADTGGSGLNRAWGDYEESLAEAPWLWDVSGINADRSPATGNNIVDVPLAEPPEESRWTECHIDIGSMAACRAKTDDYLASIGQDPVPDWSNPDEAYTYLTGLKWGNGESIFSPCTPEIACYWTSRENAECYALPTDSLIFSGSTFDNACNLNQNVGNGIFDYEQPWLITRGGLVYSRDALNFSAKGITGDENLCPDDDQACASFVDYPFNFGRKEAALSTEWLSTEATLVENHMINSSTSSSFKSEGYDDDNNQLWYSNLVGMAETNLAEYPDRFQVVNALAAPGATSSSHCDDETKVCVITTSGDFTINNTFTCDRETFIFVEGSLTVSNEIKTEGTTNGCIFAVKENVLLNPVKTVPYSTDFPQYDTLEAFIISDGQIKIEPSPQQYGIQVWGALLSFGAVDNHSVSFKRYLQNDHNQNVPAYLLHHDSRYYSIARRVVSEDNEAYMQEVGRKLAF